jgi:hypothetical protein
VKDGRKDRLIHISRSFLFSYEDLGAFYLHLNLCQHVVRRPHSEIPLSNTLLVHAEYGEVDICVRNILGPRITLTYVLLSIGQRLYNQKCFVCLAVRCRFR